MSDATLLDLFDPPEGLAVYAAVLVAMSATEPLLEQVMERLTGLSAAQRARQGAVIAALLRDGRATDTHREVLPPGRVPGLYEFHPRPDAQGALLHAKLALLGFGPPHADAPTHARLAVLTANFTETSARHQLELVWSVDAPLDGTADAVDRADLFACAEFVTTLLETRFFAKVTTKDRAPWKPRIPTLLDALRTLGPGGARPRFVHSLTQPLLPQVKLRLTNLVGHDRNLLLCGSGFWETPGGQGTKPEVLTRIERLGVFTNRPLRVAVANPTNAGALAAWAPQAEDDAWTLAPAVDPRGGSRMLHAKFIYVGRMHGGRAVNGALYLGSGNLTHKGLLLAANAGGNVECGVVFGVPEPLDADALAARLFWRDGDGAINAWEAGGDDDAGAVTGMIVAPPVLWAEGIEGPPRGLRLHARDALAPQTQVEVTWSGATWRATRVDEVVSLGAGDTPATIEVRSPGAAQVWVVPVVDGAGRVAWVPPRYETWEDALDAVLDFPASAVDEPEAAPEDEHEGEGAGRAATTETAARTYALHVAATLVEGIAATQSALPPPAHAGWIAHLDRTLRGEFPQPLLAAWRAMGLNPLAHLEARALVPHELSAEDRRRYREVLCGAAQRWGLR